MLPSNRVCPFSRALSSTLPHRDFLPRTLLRFPRLGLPPSGPGNRDRPLAEFRSTQRVSVALLEGIFVEINIDRLSASQYDETPPLLHPFDSTTASRFRRDE